MDLNFTGQTVQESRTEVKADARNRKRVSGNIAAIILEFLKERAKSPSSYFTMNELEDYVNERHYVTAGSAGRILRDLRLIGKVQCEMKDRSRSLYSVWSVSN
jgi:DNA-binding PadR family transcriptional regulator